MITENNVIFRRKITIQTKPKFPVFSPDLLFPLESTLHKVLIMTLSNHAPHSSQLDLISSGGMVGFHSSGTICLFRGGICRGFHSTFRRAFRIFHHMQDCPLHFASQLSSTVYIFYRCSIFIYAFSIRYRIPFG